MSALPSSWALKKKAKSLVIWRLDLLIDGTRPHDVLYAGGFGFAQIEERYRSGRLFMISSTWDDHADRPTMARSVATWFHDGCEVAAILARELAASGTRSSHYWRSEGRINAEIPDRPEGLALIVDLIKATFLRVYESCFICSIDPSESLYRRPTA